MIIPIRCFTCGMVLADKYRYYQINVRERKLNSKKGNQDKVTYLTPEFRQKGIEGQVLDELKLTNMCCRTHFLTHVDIE